jgi:hypothetical protein
VITLCQTIYGKVPRRNFLPHWRALKSCIKADKGRAVKHREHYDHDVAIYTLAKDNPLEWYGSSKAKYLLKQDVENELHLTNHPAILYYLQHDKYHNFDYQLFCWHIHQYARAALP